MSALAQGDAERLPASLLWDKLVEVAVVEDFRPSPEDDFLHTYGLADEDLDEDVILEILKSSGFQVPSPDIAQQVGKISSPADFMELVRHAAREERPIIA